MKSKSTFYLAKAASQFVSVAPLWYRIGGTFLTWEIKGSRLGKKWPIKEWSIRHFPKMRNNSKFFRQIKQLFPGCEYDTIRHFYLGPYPDDVKILICMTMFPIPPQDKRDFVTFQFYHGVVDKRFKVGVRREYPPMFDQWDYWMLPGEKDRQKLLFHCKNAGITLNEDRLVKIGYLRFDKIINKNYDKRELMNLAGVPDNGRKNILFAPTWRWGGGTLMSHYKEFCNKIPKTHNLIIRNHTNDSRRIREVMQYCEDNSIENVYFVSDEIMNITDNMVFADLMISDNSSVAYDFLILGRPLIFNKTESPDVITPEYRFNVRRCGYEYDIESEDILDVIEKSFSSDKFKSHIEEVKHNCFYFLDGKSTDRAVEFITSARKPI